MPPTLRQELTLEPGPFYPACASISGNETPREAKDRYARLWATEKMKPLFQEKRQPIRRAGCLDAHGPASPSRYRRYRRQVSAPASVRSAGGGPNTQIQALLKVQVLSPDSCHTKKAILPASRRVIVTDPRRTRLT